METSAPNESIEGLLEHAGWLRNLAGSLVGDAGADDLVQEAYVAAMQSPPDPTKSAKPWLARVVKNAAKMRHRSDARRADREVAADAPAQLDSPVDAVERVQLQRLLCELVVELPEPYRATVVALYLDGLQAAELARRDGIKPATVRQRHKQALELLRGMLDERNAGDRRSWLAALLPIAQLNHAPSATLGGSATAAAAKGWLAMKGIRVAVAAFLILSISAGVVMWLRTDAGHSSASGERAEARTPSHLAIARSFRAPVPNVVRQRADDPIGSLLLEGQVVDEDMLPVAGATVAISTKPPRTTTSQVDGSFSFDRLVSRSYGLAAHRDSRYAGSVAALLTDKSNPVILTLQQGAEVRVDVVDALDQAAVSGAAVELESVSGLIVHTATTDGDGAVHLEGLAPGFHRLRATHPEYAPRGANLSIPANVGGVVRERVALLAGAPVSGVVQAADGTPVAGATVHAFFGARRSFARSVETDSSGRFELAALAAGVYRFVAEHELYADADSGIVELDGVRPLAGLVISVRPTVEIAGRVVDSDGAPVAGARIVAANKQRIQTWFGAEATSDERGEFSITGVGRNRVAVAASHAIGSSEPVDIDMTDNSHHAGLELRLSVSGTVRGRVIDEGGAPVDGARVSLAPDDLDDYWRRHVVDEQVQLTDMGGRFEFRALPEGAYVVEAAKSRAGSARQTVSTHEAEAVITLGGFGSVRGRVELDTGEVPSSFAIALNLREVWFHDTGGEFELLDVQAATYRLTAVGPFHPEEVGDIEVEAGKTTEIGTVKVDAGRAVRGIVRDRDGAPAGGATVMAAKILEAGARSFEVPENAAWKNSRKTTSRRDGSFELSGLGDDKLAVAAEHSHHGRSDVVWISESGDTGAVELLLGDGGGIEGVVTLGKDGAERTRIGVFPLDDQGVRTQVTTAQDGSFRVDRLAAGRYRVIASLPAESTSTQATQAAIRSSTVEVVAGQTARVDIAFPKGAHVTVTLVKPADMPATPIGVYMIAAGVNPRTAQELEAVGDELETSDVLRSLMQFRSGNRTSGQFRHLPAGTYTVCAEPSTVKPTADNTVTLVAADDQPLACRRVRVGNVDVAVTLTVPQRLK